MIVLVILVIVFLILLIVTNVFWIYVRIHSDTLARWTRHKDLFWATSFKKIRVIYCTGNGFIDLYKGEFDIFTTCTNTTTYDKYKHLWTAPIKFLKGIDEEGYLIVQLWNTKKLNRIYKDDTK